jgi:HPt (histidine-containing phosphotransfer) domain-containing protein
MRPDLDEQTIERLQKLGGKTLLSQLVELFTSHAESAIRDASSGLAQGNLDVVRRAAHSLKSSAGNLGATQVQILADEIELMAEQDAVDIQPLLADLEKAYLRAKDLLTEAVERT